MQKKILKFRDHLTKLILDGKKNSTWRLFDDKNLSEGDEIDLVNWNTGEKFGEAALTKVWKKRMGELKEADFDGHEKFESTEEMYAHYREYYGERVNADTEVLIAQFQLK